MSRKLWQTSVSLDAAVETYTVGEDPALDARLLPYEVYGTLAHAAGLVKLGVLTRAEHGKLRKALGKLNGSFRITRAQEDIHTAVEQYLGEVGQKVHAGRSRNDQVQVDLRLYLKDALGELQLSALSAAAAWSDFGKKHAGVLMPGYTHLQRAMPTTVEHWAASHAEALLDSVNTLEAAYVEVDQCPLGSAAGFGVMLPLPRAYVAKLLGFSRVQRNTLRVQTSRPRIEAAVVSALALAARDLGALAWDLSLFMTREFGFLSLDGSFTTGSSLMPNKKNPDVVELTRARAALFPGWLNQILSLGQLPSGYHRDYQLTKGPLMAAVTTAGQLFDMAGRLPASLTVDRARCKAAVTSEMLATHRVMTMVREGVPFRKAYRELADAARASAGQAVDDAALPSYAGAPGKPELAALDRERAALERKLKARQEKLRAAWKRLLRPA